MEISLFLFNYIYFLPLLNKLFLLLIIIVNNFVLINLKNKKKRDLQAAYFRSLQRMALAALGLQY